MSYVGWPLTASTAHRRMAAWPRAPPCMHHRTTQPPRHDEEVAQSATTTQSRMVQIERDILAKNDGLRRANRPFRRAGDLRAQSRVQSRFGKDQPAGAGPFERCCAAKLPIAVIEGDQQTSHDAERIRATGAPAVQINTGKGCHLDAHMVGHALTPVAGRRFAAADRKRRQPRLPGGLRSWRGAQGGDPFGDRGRRQAAQVPDMFHAAVADAAQQDRPAALPFLQRRAAISYARQVNPQLQVIEVSATTGEGFGAVAGLAEGRLHGAAGEEKGDRGRAAAPHRRT
jgi:hydrogenase nickel incorporation protein HypB